jgi:hypothetical protein
MNWMLQRGSEPAFDEVKKRWSLRRPKFFGQRIKKAGQALSP